MNVTKKLVLTTLAGSVLALSGGSAMAGSSTGSINLNATVVTNCVVSAGGTFVLDATYDEIGTNATAAATYTNPNAFQINCTKGAAANIAIADTPLIDSGTDRYATGTAGGNTDTLHYILYYDSVGGSAWGDKGSTGSSSLEKPFTGTGVAVNVPLYASIPGGQAITADTYSETLTVKVWF